MTAASPETKSGRSKGPPRGLLASAALALTAVGLVAAISLAQGGLRGVRIDLTEQKLYSLTDGSREVVARIDEPIRLELYFSELLGREAPAYASYARRVRDLLEEYARLSDNLTLETIDPEPFSEAEDRAVAANLQQVPLDRIGNQVFFGLVGINSTDGREIIPFFQSEREAFLEYDITRMILTLSDPEPTVLGVITTLPLAGGAIANPFAPPRPGSEPAVAYTQIQQFHETRILYRPGPPGAPAEIDVKRIGPDIDVLMLVHPKGLTQATEYAIDQFLMRDGRALVFLDPHAESQAGSDPGGAPDRPTFSDASVLLKTLGVSYDPHVVIGDLVTAQRVAAPGSTRPVDYVAWQALRPFNMNREDVVTGELEAITVASAGAIGPVEGAGTQFTALLFTTLEAGPIEADDVRFQPDPAALVETFEPTGEPMTIAARVSGPLKSAFPDGPPKADGDAGQQPAPDPAEHLPEHLSESTRDANVIVVADTDILQDRFWVRAQNFFGQRVTVPLADNGAFAINAVDQLAGGGALIGLRSRGVSSRPFTILEEMERKADRRLRAKEQELLERLRETEDRLNVLQSGRAVRDSAVLSDEQEAELVRFRAETLRIRKDLRTVRLELRKETEALRGRLEFLNIAVAPLLALAIAVIQGALVWRRRRHLVVGG